MKIYLNRREDGNAVFSRGNPTHLVVTAMQNIRDSVFKKLDVNVATNWDQDKRVGSDTVRLVIENKDKDVFILLEEDETMEVYNLLKSEFISLEKRRKADKAPKKTPEPLGKKK